jgi:hypothetical protein
MIKKIFLTLLVVWPNLAIASSISISAKYREAANTFVIMDCVSGWWDKTFCQDDGGAYQKYWTEHFGLTGEDQDLLKKYDSVRQRHYKGLGLPRDDFGPFKDGLFAKRTGISEDRLAPAFYSSDTLEQALEKLRTEVSQEDLGFLKSFYEHFKPKYQKLLRESEPFKKKAMELNRKLQNKKYAAFFSMISRYYSVSENMNYEVLYAWFPPLERDSASPTDKFLVFQQNPIKHIHSDDEDIVFHEIIHTLSARQPQKQKEEISKIFLEACPSLTEKFVGTNRGRILEEPMAVAIGQIQFLKETSPSRLKWDSKLYNNPWINVFAKLIHPVVEDDLTKKRQFSVETGKKLGFLCNEFFQASTLMSESQK